MIKHHLLHVYPSPLIEGVFIKRYKRFLVDVGLPNGQVVVAHCANSGSMKSCLLPHAKVYLTDHDGDKKRKLRYSLQLMVLEDGYACVNTSVANSLVTQLFAYGFKHRDSGILPPLFYEDFPQEAHVQSEVFYDQQSRFDFCLTEPQTDLKKSVLPKTWVEVKSVSLCLNGTHLAFPDAVTTRGQKHLRTLMAAVKGHDRAFLFYVIMRSSHWSVEKIFNNFGVAESIDPAYSQLCRDAQNTGVACRIIVADIGLDGMGVRGYGPIQIKDVP